MSDDLRSLIEMDRLIHEPACLLIVTILSTVESADFLFLQRETEMTQRQPVSASEQAGKCWVRTNIEKTFKGKLPLTVCKLTKVWRESF